jgi:hypothetical protein
MAGKYTDNLLAWVGRATQSSDPLLLVMAACDSCVLRELPFALTTSPRACSFAADSLSGVLAIGLE